MQPRLTLAAVLRQASERQRQQWHQEMLEWTHRCTWTLTVTGAARQDGDGPRSAETMATAGQT